MNNPIFNATNKPIKVTNPFSTVGITMDTLSGLPLGTVGNSATGEIGLKVISLSGGGGGGASTIADGADVTEGAIADAVVAAGAAGTVSAKLRRLTTDIDAFKTANHADLIAATPAGANVIGHVIVDTAPTTAVTGTFYQATQPVSLTAAPVLVAGAAVIGKVGIDHTTPGTTDLVSIISGQVSASAGAGVSDAGTQRVILASDGPTVTVLGTTTDAAVGDATGSVNAHVRQVAKSLVSGPLAPAGSLSTIPASLLTTGTLTATGSVTLVTNGAASVTVSVSGSFSATWIAEGSYDNGATWLAALGVVPDGVGNTGFAAFDFGSGATSASRRISFNTVPYNQFRVRCATYTSGTLSVAMISSAIVAPATAHVIYSSTSGSEGGYSSPSVISTVVDSGNGSTRPLAVAPILSTGSSPNAYTRTPNIFKVINAVTITSETTVWTPASGKKFRLMGYQLMSGATGGNVLLNNQAAGYTPGVGGTTLLLAGLNVANAQLSSPPGMGNGILSSAANNVLTALGATGQIISGYVFGTEE